uniref:Uncharacterized protein n=1 Tax=Spongospora subterranea TaxID=70186 RepID=A0A0H5RD57_9EUKA|eukprot:CRZ06456.1 hypothetical protein [Spongospora subterranea]
MLERRLSPFGPITFSPFGDQFLLMCNVCQISAPKSQRFKVSLARWGTLPHPGTNSTTFPAQLECTLCSATSVYTSSNIDDQRRPNLHRHRLPRQFSSERGPPELELDPEPSWAAEVEQELNSAGG